jgi:TRAP-type C4-dicarboxylate transport system substrate-binding protein
MSKQLTWVIAHEPYDLFLNATHHFAEQLSDRTQGRYTVRVISLSDWSNETGIEVSYKSADRHRVINLVRNGGVDIATTYVENLGTISKDFFCVGIPYLFRDDDHATRVLDGVIGRQILDGLNTADSDLVGLAFTYSGGFRVITGNRRIDRLEDFADAHVFCSKSPISVDTFTALGAIPHPDNIDFFKEALDAGEVDLGSTTYARFFSGGYNTSAQFINHTEHSLFLTSMIMNAESFKSMTPEDQEIVRTLAIECAIMERQESIADNARVQAEAAAAGIPTVFLPDSERARFIEAVQPIKEKYYDFFSPGLIQSIEAA